MWKKNFFALPVMLVSVFGMAQNIYNTDGTLTANRTVTLNGKTLNFNSTTANGNLFINGTTGNVGIGNVSPTSKLDVSGVVKSKNLFATNTGTSATTYANTTEYLNNTYVFGAGYEMSDGLITRRMLNFYDRHQYSTLLAADYFLLNVVDRGNKDRLLFNGYKAGGTNNGSSFFVLNDKNGYENFKVIDDGSNNTYVQMAKANSKLTIGGYTTSALHKLVVQNGSALIEGNILTNSNIGIGTSNFTDGADTYRLSVNGAVRANRVKVYTTWADYVFEKNYALPTLEEVEKHIVTKGHLKDIPSAKEVEQNGIELGEMNKLLLQKVEELTLYVIELNKELKDVKIQLKKD